MDPGLGSNHKLTGLTSEVGKALKLSVKSMTDGKKNMTSSTSGLLPWYYQEKHPLQARSILRHYANVLFQKNF